MKQIVLFLCLTCISHTQAQITETFKGPEVQTTNPWQGHPDLFEINAHQQLEFISPKGENGEATLFLPVSYSPDMTWEFRVKLDFKTTTSNYLRIYLHTTTEKDPTQYYVQIGTNDGQVNICSAKNGSGKTQIAGRKGLVGENSDFIRIRVTLKENREWALYTQLANETDFRKEGTWSKAIPEPANRGEIRLVYRYIKGRISYYWMDYIQITSSITDTDGNGGGNNPGGSTGHRTEPFEIIFNEILPNPYEGGSEYIELYNRSERTLSLDGLGIATRKADGTLQTTYSLSSITAALEPEAYLLLSKDISGVESFYSISYPERLYQLKLPVLANTFSTLVLFRLDDQKVIDELSYHVKWHSDQVKSEKGIALERINPDAPTQDKENWTSAAFTAGYGTPGYKNSQYMSGNEEIPTSIGKPEYREDGSYLIPFRFDKPGYACRAFIYDLSGRRLAEIANHITTGTEGKLHWDGNINGKNRLPSGLYILFIEIYHPAGESHRFKKSFLVR